MGRLEMKRVIIFILVLTAMHISCSEDSIIAPPQPRPPVEFYMMFDTRLVYQVGREPYCVSAGDFDCDGAIDLVTVNQYSEDASILLNDGRGIFREAGTYGTGQEPCFVIACDIDSDGGDDLVIANQSSRTMSTYFCRGNGTFTRRLDYPIEYMPYSIAMCDIYGNGDLDAVVAGMGNSISVLNNLGNGVFDTTSVHPVELGCVDICAGDFDGDGSNDLAATSMMGSVFSSTAGTGRWRTPSDMKWAPIPLWLLRFHATSTSTVMMIW